MWFERTSRVVGRRVASKHDCFGVLQGGVEGVAEIHEESVALLAKAIFDVGIQVSCFMQWVGCPHSREQKPKYAPIESYLDWAVHLKS